MQDVAGQFVRVRLSRVDDQDLNLFEFDYDLTLMYFFMNADGQIYARYGGRGPESADHRMSLAGLRYTMNSVLAAHQATEKHFAPKSQPKPLFLRDLGAGWRGGRCLHCHQIKEVLNNELRRESKWSDDLMWRYPLPENLGITLEIDRGNVVKEVRASSPSAKAGLRAGDLLRRLNNVPIHSFGDAQFALDRAPKTGNIAVTWERAGKSQSASIELTDGWRRTDIAWRTSMRRYVPSARLYGTDLKPEEKKALGLSEKQLAFRQRGSVPSQAREAGIHPDDIILGVDNQSLEGDVIDFLQYVRHHYLAGDRVKVNIIRDGKRMDLTMKLQP